MATWTLVVDESGRFEADVVPWKKPENVGLVVGGVLAPHDAAILDDDWYGALTQACTQAGVRYPPHAAELDIAVKHGLRACAIARVAAFDGTWIFNTSPPVAIDEQLGVYVRMLGELVDLACRVVAAKGGTHLEMAIAQRTVPIGPQLADDVEDRGLGTTFVDRGAWVVRALAKTEVRQVLDGLAREGAGGMPGWPELAWVSSTSAASKRSHAGLVIADLGCNFIYGQLGNGGTATAPASGGREPIIVGRGGLHLVRQVDRALRATPPDLVRAGRAVAALDGHAAGISTTTSPFWLARKGSARVAHHLINDGLGALSSSSSTSLAQGIAATLAAAAEAHLALKSGDYDGTWAALDAAWCGSGALATGVRAACVDREQQARLWRLVVECANHRGDLDSGGRAIEAFDRVLSEGASLQMLAERLIVRNLAVVMTQNRFLPDDPDLPPLRGQLVHDTEALERAAGDAGALVGIATADGPGPAVSISEAEADHWRAVTGGQPRWERPDRERGRCYGTIARSRAFLGQLDLALEAAMRARAFFAGSPFDLQFNASVIARIELERARLAASASSPGPALRAALTLAGVDGVVMPQLAVEAIRARTAARFALDLILRAMLWATPPSADQAAWCEGLADGGESSLLALLSSGELRAHPTDLIARHAGEFLLSAGEARGAKRWLELGQAIAKASPPGSTTERFGRFTAALIRDPAFRGTGAPGSVLNPAFEYR